MVTAACFVNVVCFRSAFAVFHFLIVLSLLVVIVDRYADIGHCYPVHVASITGTCKQRLAAIPSFFFFNQFWGVWSFSSNKSFFELKWNLMTSTCTAFNSSILSIPNADIQGGLISRRALTIALIRECHRSLAMYLCYSRLPVMERLNKSICRFLFFYSNLSISSLFYLFIFCIPIGKIVFFYVTGTTISKRGISLREIFNFNF